jgi:hypothetical protein
MAFLDRLVEGAIILKVKGRSHRTPQAKPSENQPPETALLVRPPSAIA